MLRSVARLRRIAAGTSLKRLFINTTSAASMAISVPAPMAMPISARVNAGASFMPSPTIATLPLLCRDRITASLPSGRTPAMTSFTPACLPMAFAVRSLSPVSMTTSMPMFCSSCTAWGLSSLMTSATAMIPASLPSLLKNSGVLPCSASCSACLSISLGISATLPISRLLPPWTAEPFHVPDKPFPGRAWKSVTSSADSPSSSARCTIAFASGCSLFFSSA